jgi:hypothetical protein
VDEVTGNVMPWNPDAFGNVNALALSDAGIYAGGNFTGADNLPQAYVAAIVSASTDVHGQPAPSLELSAASWPNPIRAGARLHYVLPEAAAVTLRVFDITGRERAQLTRGVMQSPGPHDVTWRADHVPPGLYFVHLDAGWRSASLKLVVAR